MVDIYTHNTHTREWDFHLLPTIFIALCLVLKSLVSVRSHFMFSLDH